MIQQQLEEDGRRDKGPQQFSSCQALDVGTERHKGVRERKGGCEQEIFFLNLPAIKDQ